MKSFKVLTASFLSAILLISPGILAQDKLIDAVPDGFYYLEKNAENASSLVHVCSSQAKFNSENSVLEMKCNIVAEIDESYLEEFLDEIRLQQVVSNKHTKFKGSGIGLVSLSALLTVVVGVLGEGPYRKRLNTASVVQVALIGLSGLGLFAYGWSAGRLNKQNQNYYTEFESQIHSGVIGQGKRIHTFFSDHDSKYAMMEEFTNFLNQYAVPFESDSMESN